MTTPARSALAIALGGMLLARAASAQPAVPPAAAPPPSDAAAPEVQYDTYIEPFDDDPVDRLHNIIPLPPPTPLFEDYDPLNGMDQHAKTSRVVRANQAIFALGTVTVKVGATFTVPFIQHTGPTVTAHTLKFQFDPAVVRVIDAVPAQWTGASVNYNATPEHITPEKRFIVLEWGTGDFWKGEGSLLNIRLSAVGAGESDLAVYHFDMADDRFETVPALVRDGLVRVLP